MNPKLHFLFLLFLILGFINLNQNISLNPFDNSFNGTIEQLEHDNWELLSAECGYGTYGKEVNGHLLYYQFSPYKENQVVAKGIEIRIDTVDIQENFEQPYGSFLNLIDSLSNRLLAEAIDSLLINSHLQDFGIKSIAIPQDRLNTEIPDLDTTHLSYFERKRFFEDLNGKQYSAHLNTKFAKDENNRKILIRTLDFFVSHQK